MLGAKLLIDINTYWLACSPHKCQDRPWGNTKHHILKMRSTPHPLNLQQAPPKLPGLTLGTEERLNPKCSIHGDPAMLEDSQEPTRTQPKAKGNQEPLNNPLWPHLQSSGGTC